MQEGNKPQKDFTKDYKAIVGADTKVSAAPVWQYIFAVQT